MGLAILALDGIDADQARFRLDTGTNGWYQLDVGRAVRRDGELAWVDDVYLKTPLSPNPKAGAGFDSRTTATLPVGRLERGRNYVQLFTFRSRDGRSPSFSEVIELAGAAGLLPEPPADFGLPSTAMNVAVSPVAPLRCVPCRTGREALAQQMSWEELLGGLAKAAVPLLMDLLKSKGGTLKPVQAAPGVGLVGSPPAAGAPAAGASPPGASAPASDELARLVTAVLGQLAQGVAATESLSLSPQPAPANRFVDGATVSRAMAAGIDDAALLAFLGPLIEKVVQVIPGVVKPIAENAPAALRAYNEQLPLLLNALNQRRMADKVEDNRLARDTLADVNRRLVVQEFLRTQADAGRTAADPAALTALLKLLTTPAASQDAAAAGPAPARSAATAALPGAGNQVSQAKSLAAAAVPSAQAVLQFDAAPRQGWYGGEHALYARGRGVRLFLQLHRPLPGPAAALPRAIMHLVVKDAAGKVLLDKTLRVEQLAPDTPLPIELSAEELSALPTQCPLDVFAQVRWPDSGGRAESAAAATSLVLVDGWFAKRQGGFVGEEREPTDMARYRSVWNKLWEAPLIDQAGSRRERPKQVLWALDVAARFTVLLSAGRRDHAPMQTRLLREQPDPDDISDRTRGRLKGGIELGIMGLNELLPLWGDPPLPADQAAALAIRPIALAHAAELTTNLKLNGKAGQRGMVWAIPVFRRAEFVLAEASDADDSGLVRAGAESTVRFPLPVAVRLIGLRGLSA